MTEPRLDYVMCASPFGTHRMAYWEWGAPDNDKVLMCVHGLTRTGRDFDHLARAMANDYRVVCPDIVGRGKSDWLINPASYMVPQYVADILTLIARLRVQTLDWLGTSMGGLIGLGLAGALAMSVAQRPDRSAYGLAPGLTFRMGKMVLNDIGPALNLEGLARIGEYVGQPQAFDSFDQAVDYVRSVSAGFGPHSNEQWAELTRHVFNQQGAQWVKHYDLRLAEPMARETPQTIQVSEQLLWGAFTSLREPVLILRGEQSDLLLPDTADRMLASNSNARLLTFSGVGHAPTIMTQDQIEPVRQFFLTS